ncbi:DUF2867 domain-containing protein [Streptomyces halobius]|uniref:DUF2867 domain-containing protein n=1 Tax=Streptomyces halobius TaxID=2879846 RepID=A0ABY4LYM2_9ACTN|nr:DUF2867 domain-containing protein [Streptomyces halobius]UQA90604.1 DUF2867 domain-containing protein [Streptomyces halobius]
MRIPNAEYTDRPWRIHEFTQDFEVEDVWALPTPGGPDELARFVRGFTADDDEENSRFIIRNLFRLRWTLGRLLGWDKESQGLGHRVQTIRGRLPADLRDGPRGPDFESVPFIAVYQTDTEYVAELANRMVHTLMHIGWVPDQKGMYYAQMTSLWKPNGLLGHAYRTGGKPFRRVLVYPQLLRAIGKNWPQYT